MPPEVQMFEWPIPSPTTLKIIGAVFAALIAAAVLLTSSRRRKVERLRINAEWRTAEDIFEDRKLSENEIRTVKMLVKRYGKRAPLRSVTTRQGFDACVDAAMKQLENKGQTHAFDEMGVALRDIRLSLALDHVPLGQQIHSTREIHPGQSIGLAADEGAAQHWVSCNVSIVDEAYFYISPREGGGSALPQVKPGDTVRCRLWRDEDARYLFSTRVAGSETSPPMLRLNHTTDLNRMQARAHFRVRHNQAVDIGVLNASVDGRTDDAHKRSVVTRLRARVTSLSAGGCAIVVEQPVTKQVLLRIPLDLAEQGKMEVEARIVSSGSISGGRYLLRGAFIGLSDEQRDKVAKYTLHRQQHKITPVEALE